MEQRGRAGYSEMGKSGSREGSAQTYRRNAARRRFPTLPDLLCEYQHKLLAAALLYIWASALTDWCLKIIKFDNMRIKYDNHKAKIIKKPDNIRINTIGGNVINQNVESSH